MQAQRRQLEEFRLKVEVDQQALRSQLSQQKAIEQYKNYYENPQMIGIPLDAYGVNLSSRYIICFVLLFYSIFTVYAFPFLILFVYQLFFLFLLLFPLSSA